MLRFYRKPSQEQFKMQQSDLTPMLHFYNCNKVT